MYDPPSVNRSQYAFSVSDDGRILYGLGAIKGVGRAAVESLIAERKQNGPFADLFDLCRNGLASPRKPEEITVFKNGGGGHLDLMTAEYFVDKAKSVSS